MNVAFVCAVAIVLPQAALQAIQFCLHHLKLEKLILCRRMPTTHIPALSYIGFMTRRNPRKLALAKKLLDLRSSEPIGRKDAQESTTRNKAPHFPTKE